MNNWSTKKLTEVCDIVYGFAFKANEFNESGKGLSVIRIGDVDKDKTDKFFDGKYDEKYVVNRGDILLGLSGSFKANQWSGEKALLNQRVATLRNFENKTAESFVFYQLPRLFRDLEQMITQLSVKNILTKHIDSLKILYPPLVTQKQIVERLDKIAEAQKLNGGLIQKSDELFQSLLHKELNPASKDWMIRKLGEVCEFYNGKAHEPIIVENGKYIVVNSKFIASNGEIVKYSNRNLVPLIIGDIAIVMSDVPNGKALAKCFLVNQNDKFTLNQRIGLVRTNGLDKLFLYYQLNRNKYFLRFDNGQSQTNLRKNEILNCPIFIPKITEQKQIVAKLSAVQDYKTQLLAQKLKLKELFDSVLSKSFH